MNSFKLRFISIATGIFLLTSLFMMTDNNEVKAAGPVIVLDPGHGGYDPGAVSGSYYEKTLNMNLAKKIAEHLKSISPTIYYTRVFDTYLSLEDRAKFANKMNADVFLSIHHDSNISPLANGISTHYSSYRANLDTSDVYVKYNGVKYPYVDEIKIGSNTFLTYKSGSSTKSVNINSAMALDPTPSTAAKKSGTLALNIADAMANLGYNRKYTATGAYDHNLYVTRHTNMPSILIENGFMSNPQELKKITNPFNVDQTARAIANEVIKMFGVSTKAKLNSLKVDKESPQQESSSITLTANATGKDLLYAFHLYDGKSWREVQSYSTKSQFVWKPSQSGAYKFSVHVKNSGSNQKYDDYKTLDYRIYENVKMEGVSLKQPSPQLENTPIELEAKASGGVKLEYKFNLFDGQEWKDLTGYTGNSKLTWRPSSPGTYKFSVHVREATSTEPYDDYHAFEYNILEEINIESLTTDKVSPQKKDTEINLETSATGGSQILYKYWVYDGVNWVVLRDYSENPKFTWKPTKNGEYKIVVHVKDKSSAKEYDAYKAELFDIADSDLKLTFTKESPQRTKTNILMEADTSISDDLLYRFLIKSKDTNQETVLQKYSTDKSVEWSPTMGGEYQITVQVKSKESIKEFDYERSYTYEIIPDPIAVSSVSSSIASPQNVGKTIRLTTNANGGINKLYKYWIYDGTGWKVIRDYQSSNSFDWTPSKAGKYRFSVHVKDENSTKEYDAYKGFEYEIKVGPVKAQSLSVDKTSPQSEGTKLTLTASATGGTNKLYKFHIYDGKTWRVLRDYQASNTVNWTPQQAGEYKLVVHVKDQTSKKEYDSYTSTFYTINKVPVDITDVKVGYESPQAVNVPITLEAQASGGVTKLYKFNVYDGKEWKDLTGYVTNPRYTWTPSKPGNYKFSVHVKDSRSKASYDDYYAFFYDVVEPVKISNVTYPSVIESIGSPIDITAGSVGGTLPLYKFWIEENGEWKVLQDYSSDSTISWTPNKKGTFKFSVHLKNQYSSKQYDDYKGFSIIVK
ncbi:triple tyrosine motif-containing protein [Metabacillus halosaccharovorans]|uniref:triple tyrosine motif-containing protein n=1 Tax=Metabacillus halosaccharovorans TaxID=930124 RepID=UPI003736D5E6